MPISFTMEEVLAIQSGSESEELKAKVNEAKNLEKFNTLRTAAKDKYSANANGLIAKLKAINIPAGIKEITLIYDLVPETMKFGVRTSGVKVEYKGEGVVSEEVTKIVTMAETAKHNKNPQPLSFIVKAIGESRVSHIQTLRDFNESGKPKLDALYTNAEAQPLSEGVNELPKGDKARIQVRYRFDAPILDSDGDTEARWLDPLVSVGTKLAGGASKTGGNGQGFRVTAPDGFKNWSEFGRTGDTQAQEIYNKAVEKYGSDFQKKQSFANLLKAAKHPVYLAQHEAAQARQATK